MKNLLELGKSLMEDLEDYGVILIDKNGKIIKWNKGAEKIKGYKPSEIIGKNFSVLFTDEDRRNHLPKKLINEAGKQGRVTYEAWRVRKDGTVFWASVAITTLHDENKKITGFSKIIKDLTETRTNAEFDRSNLHALLNNTHDHMWSVSRDYKLITANQSFNNVVHTLSGATIDIGTSVFTEQFTPAQNLEFKIFYDRAFAGEVFTEIVHTVAPLECWSEISFVPIIQGDHIIGTACHAHDVTARKKVQRQLRHNELRFKQVQEIAHIGGWEYNITSRLITLSDEACRILGLPPGECILSYDSWLALIHPGDLESVLEMFSNARRTLSDGDIRHRIVRKDEGVRHVHLLTKYEFDSIGEPVGTYGALHDITDQETAKEKLRNGEHRFRSLIENSADGLCIFSAEGKMTYVSPAITAILGYTEEEIMHIDLDSIVHTEDIATRSEMLTRVLANPGVPISGFCKPMRHKDGSWRYIESTMTNLLDDPAINGIADNFRDITERKTAESKIVYLNKLYSFISQVNQTIVRSADENTLCKEICRVAVEFAGFKVAWIGSVKTECSTFTLIAQHGMQSGDECKFINVAYNKNGPVDRVANTGKYHLTSFENDPFLDNWKSFALPRKWNSYITFPLTRSGKIIATLNIVASEDNFFDAEKIALLDELAVDISYALDVFEKERLRAVAVQKLKHSEARLKQAQEIAHFGNWELDLTTMMLFWSEEACRIYGLPPDDNIHSLASWLTFIHPDDLGHVEKIVQEGLTTFNDTSFYYRIVRRDGSVRYIYTIAHFEFDDEGVPGIVFGASHDVTSIKIAENKIKHSEHRLKQAQEIAHFGSWESDFSTGIVLWSDEACRIYGLPPADNKCSYAQWLSFIHPDDLEHVLETIKKAEATLSSSSFYHRIIRRDKTIRYIHSRAHYEFDVDGKTIGQFGVAHDITDEVANISKLKIQNEQLQDIAWIQSHKVRGPLANILGLAQQFNNSESQEETAQIIQGILQSSENLDKVIREIVSKTKASEINDNHHLQRD